MERFGASAEQLKELAGSLAAQREASIFGVWPENWRALRVFLAMSTQWRMVGGMSVMRTGLDYGVLDAVDSRIRTSPDAPEPDRFTLFRQIRDMERTALDIFNNTH